MLSPGYLDRFSDQLLAIIDEFSVSVVSDIAKRIIRMGNISETSNYQIEILQNAGMIYDDVIRRISQVTGYTEAEVRRMFEEAGVKTIENESVYYKAAGKDTIVLNQSEAMQQILSANIEKTFGDLSNLTMTTAIKAQTLFIDTCNVAMMQIQTGALNYNRAVANAIKKAARISTEVLYPTGHVDKLDVATRRAALTGVNQTAAEINLQYAKEAGCDYVETTAHAGARPSHAVWQGRVFCISGNDKEYPPFYESTGYGTGPGLCGWNCRHNFHAYFPGISSPAYTKSMLKEYDSKNMEYNGVKYTEYEVSQMQRAHERKIREYKRVLAGLDSGMESSRNEETKNALKKEFNTQSIKLKEQEAELKNLCYQTGRRYESARTQVHATRDKNGNIVGFSRSVSQKAVWANRKSKK